jgi:hypothetical protein
VMMRTRLWKTVSSNAFEELPLNTLSNSDEASQANAFLCAAAQSDASQWSRLCRNAARPS